MKLTDSHELWLSIERSRAALWLEDNPEHKGPEGFIQMIEHGFDIMFGRAPPIEGPEIVIGRAWNLTLIQAMDDIAAKKGYTLQQFTRKELPWYQDALPYMSGDKEPS